MSSTLRQTVSGAIFLQLGLELGWLFAAVILAITYHSSLPSLPALTPALLFAILMVCLNGTLGLYRRDRSLSFSEYLLREVPALFIGLVIVYLSVPFLPGGVAFQQVLGSTLFLALVGLIGVRLFVRSSLARTLLPHRVLVLGTGADARAVDMSLSVATSPFLHLVGFYPLDKVPERTIAAGRILSSNISLEDTVKHLGVDEIIVAAREQRGGVLPLRALLECRLNGIQVTDLARYFERVHGRVPIDSLKVSWLIYGSGFRQSWLRGVTKRAFDVLAAIVLLSITLPIMAVAALLILIEGGAPIIYRQERVGRSGKTFILLKFRSMSHDAEKDGRESWATVNDLRVTNTGRFLRRTRIDELPQLLNVFKGNMSFVGPRPERPQFVAMLTEKIPFYAVRHSVKPGITGWAQVRYTYGATVEESMKKLEYDLYYVKNHTVFLDLLILLDTVRVVMLGKGAR
jgi:sugar transferase (PEP-CTERM system associated)